MVRVNRGDVVLCDLNPVIGTEQAGVRPVIVVQFDRANTVSPRTIVVPLTSKIRKVLLSSHVFIPAGVAGLTLDRVALCEQIRAIDLQRVIKVMGRLDATTMDAVSAALRIILDL
jgi:mRNA interferase MazF